jgi:hypothetical protein
LVWETKSIARSILTTYGRLSCIVANRIDLECEDTIHGIPYIITLTVIQMKEVNKAYNTLLGRPWLIDAKVNHD